jgi:F-type H+-transporting ATPase subunit b
MYEIVQAFGIDGRLILIQIVNFVVLAVVLWYFLYKPILSILRERQARIEKGMKDAEEAAQAKAAAQSEREAMLAATNREAEEVAKRAREHAALLSAAMRQEAEEKSAAILREATLQGEDLKGRLLKESEAEVAKVAILAAEKILRERSGHTT